MKIVIQRVRHARVIVQEQAIASIPKGLMVLVGIKEGDTEKQARWLIKKLLKMRIFEDEQGKMNESVTDQKGALLLVPNFTLYANAAKGNRPSYIAAEKPGKARKLFEKMLVLLQQQTELQLASGQFGANMQVELCNDGPVTIVLERNPQ